MKRVFASLLGLILLALVGFLTVGPGATEKNMNKLIPYPPYNVSPEALALHRSLVIGDWHSDSLLWKRNLLKKSDRGHVDFPRLREGNVALQMFTVVTKVPAGRNYDENAADTRDNITLLALGQLWPMKTWGSIYERAIYQAEKLARFEARSKGSVKIILNQSDLDDVLMRRAAGEEVTGALLGTEGAHPLEGDLSKFDGLEAAGYRMIALQHFFDNEVGGSLHGIGDQGLTPFGREVVAEIAKRPMILDLSHSSPQVARDVLAMTNMPLVVSHTGIYSHYASKRNFQDELMREIAGRGGVIAIGYWASVTGDDTPAGVAATIKAAINVVGEDHVSLGSDYDGSITARFDTSELAALTQALIDAGISEGQIRKVMGENMVRVLRSRLN